jgi:hypothetical protein
VYYVNLSYYHYLNIQLDIYNLVGYNHFGAQYIIKCLEHWIITIYKGLYYVIADISMQNIGFIKHLKIKK